MKKNTPNEDIMVLTVIVGLILVFMGCWFSSLNGHRVERVHKDIIRVETKLDELLKRTSR